MIASARFTQEAHLGIVPPRAYHYEDDLDRSREITVAQVFVSYAREDANWLDKFRIHMKPVERDHDILVWDDTHVKAGENWKAQIEGALKSAKVAVLFISAEFFASDFIHANELPPLLAAAKKEGVQVLPLIVGHSRFAKTQLSDYQAVNALSAPLRGMTESDRDLVFLNLADRIEEIFQGIKADDAEEAESADKVEPQSEVFHPGNRAASRSKLEPCKFYVSPFFARAKLWDLYADVQVELLHDAPRENVFLIPSGATPPPLRETAHLRAPEGAVDLARKRELTERFIDSYRNRELTGYKFTTITRTGEIRTKVYSAAYDTFLRDNF